MTPSFPALRLRRTRVAPWSRRMVAENVLTPSDLIWPLFIAEGSGVEEPIATLPGVSRWSVDHIARRAREARDLGIPCIALFPNTPQTLRTTDGREAFNPDNLICRAVRAIKDAAPEVGVLTDVATDRLSLQATPAAIRLSATPTRVVLNNPSAGSSRNPVAPAPNVAPSVFSAFPLLEIEPYRY